MHRTTSHSSRRRESRIAATTVAVALATTVIAATTNAGNPGLQPPVPLPKDIFKPFRDALDELRPAMEPLARMLADGERLRAELAHPAAPGDHQELARRQRAMAQVLEIVMPPLETFIGRAPSLVGRYEDGITEVRQLGHDARMAVTPACAAARECESRWCSTDRRTCDAGMSFAAGVDQVAAFLESDRVKLEDTLGELAEAHAALRRALEAGRVLAGASEKFHGQLEGNAPPAEIRRSIHKMQDAIELLHSLFDLFPQAYPAPAVPTLADGGSTR